MTRSIVLAMLACLFAGPGMAKGASLGPDSTMEEWSQASPADRDATIEAIVPGLSNAFGARKSEILACLNVAGENAAHASLTVGEIARACAAAANPRQSPTQSDDI